MTIISISAANATEKPSEKREFGVRSIELDKSFAIDKHCSKYYENSQKFNVCVKSSTDLIEKKYQKLDKKFSGEIK